MVKPGELFKVDPDFKPVTARRFKSWFPYWAQQERLRREAATGCAHHYERIPGMTVRLTTKDGKEIPAAVEQCGKCKYAILYLTGSYRGQIAVDQGRLRAAIEKASAPADVGEAGEGPEQSHGEG